jgi:hypothetical protein
LALIIFSGAAYYITGQISRDIEVIPAKLKDQISSIWYFDGADPRQYDSYSGFLEAIHLPHNTAIEIDKSKYDTVLDALQEIPVKRYHNDNRGKKFDDYFLNGYSLEFGNGEYIIVSYILNSTCLIIEKNGDVKTYSFASGYEGNYNSLLGKIVN